MQVSSRDDEIPLVSLVDAVNVKEVKGVFLRSAVAVFAAGRAVDVVEADVVCGVPFEEELPSFDVDFLEPAVLDPTAFAETEVCAVDLVFVVYCYECCALGCDAELV